MVKVSLILLVKVCHFHALGGTAGVDESFVWNYGLVAEDLIYNLGGLGGAEERGVVDTSNS